jgi:DNA-binding MarR family transcriptional regulator
MQIFPRVLRIAHRDSAFSPGEIAFLGCIYDAGMHGRPHLTPSDIGKQLGISRPAVTAIINRMLGEGLIGRTIDKVDKRRVRIALTQKGSQQFESAWEDVIGIMQRLLLMLGTENGTELVRLLQQALGILTSPEFQQ